MKMSDGDGQVDKKENREKTMIKSRMGLTRRGLIAAGTVLPLVGILPARAEAAEFKYKFATGQDPSHPINKRAAEAMDRIRQATDGRVDIKLFPANQLGSDTDLLSQVR
jgi:TRAP-type C4-dicarboxylate transport system substrate-binding protein